jgi:hypothetical protein
MLLGIPDERVHVAEPSFKPRILICIMVDIVKGAEYIIQGCAVSEAFDQGLDSMSALFLPQM